MAAAAPGGPAAALAVAAAWGDARFDDRLLGRSSSEPSSSSSSSPVVLDLDLESLDSSAARDGVATAAPKTAGLGTSCTGAVVAAAASVDDRRAESSLARFGGADGASGVGGGGGAGSVGAARTGAGGGGGCAGDEALVRLCTTGRSVDDRPRDDRAMSR